MSLARLPLTLRALVLVPLLAAGMDQARASLCGPGARSCFEAAGQTGMGVAGVLVLVLYALGSALLIARVARGRRPSLGLWAIGTAGLWAACGGQALLVDALGGASVLGGGWLQLLALGVLAGAVLALALRALPAARELVESLRPGAPRASWPVEPACAIPAGTPGSPRIAFARLGRDRAPPAAALT